MESTRSIEANNKTYQKLKYKQNLTESCVGTPTHIPTFVQKKNKHIDSDSQMTNSWVYMIFFSYFDNKFVIRTHL